MRFVHLRVHSYFSFGVGTADIEGLINHAKQLKMDALALTDSNGLYGAVRFLKHAKKMGIKPIIGVELTMEGNDKIILLAENREGYSSLCHLISKMQLKTTKKGPSCSRKLLKKHTKGVICLSGGPDGGICQLLAHQKNDEAMLSLEWYLNVFGKDRFFLELQNHGLPEDKWLIQNTLALARSYNVSCVATNNVHFTHREGYELHKALVKTSKTVHHREMIPKENAEFYLKSDEQMTELFRDFPEVVQSTGNIADRCTLDLDLGVLRPPNIPIGSLKSQQHILEDKCQAALSEYYSDNKPQAEKRLKSELKIIGEKELAGYFLLVSEIVDYAKQKRIRHSCRGSGAASIVLYLLGVSKVDPMAFDLLFERFLNPERAHLPDIDLDFDSRRRDEILEHLFNLYSPEKACMVATISTYEARSATREIARSMGMDYPSINTLMKHLPYVNASRLNEVLQLLPELSSSRLRGKKFEGLVKLVEGISGFPHHLSVHLGGVVIYEGLQDLVPVQKSAKGIPVAQFDKDDIETLGLIKTDLLSLRMLGALEEAVEQIKRQHPDFDLEKIPFDDRSVYEFICSTQTVGCFQLESPGMRQLLGRLQPENFSDIIANISLFRPGPMQADMINPFIGRRRNEEEITYLHPTLEPILKESYGVIIFQEQVIRILKEIAGLTLGQADLFRRSMTESIDAREMIALRDTFLAGAKKKGVDHKVAKKIFEKISSFASFGFPKSHAVSFAKIAYESCYLKKHHTLAYFLGVLNNQPGLYPLGVLVNEARKCGIKIKAVDINQSNELFTVLDNSLITGITFVKGIGPNAIAKILQARSKGGPFNELNDFQKRTKLSKSVIKNLILSGAFDAFEANRRRLYSYFLEGASTDEEDFSLSEKSAMEYNTMGFSFSGHPIQFHRKKLSRKGVITANELEEARHGQSVRVAGIKVVLHTPPTRSGKRVVFLTLEDETGLSDITVFEDVQEKHAKHIFGKQTLLVEGVVQRTGPRALAIIATKVNYLGNRTG